MPTPTAPPPETPQKPRRELTPVQVLLDDDDLLLLDEATQLERLSKSAVLRRALRAYHREIQSTKKTTLALTG